MPTTIYFSYIQNYTATIHFSCAPPRTVACKAAPASTAPASAELRSQLRALLRASESRPGADFVPSLLASRPPVADALAVVAAAPSKKSDPRALETGAIAPALTPGAAPPPAYAYGAALHREPVVPAAIRRHALSDDVDAEAYLSSGAGAALCRSALSVDRTTGDAALSAVARICEVHPGCAPVLASLLYRAVSARAAEAQAEEEAESADASYRSAAAAEQGRVEARTPHASQACRAAGTLLRLGMESGHCGGTAAMMVLCAVGGTAAGEVVAIACDRTAPAVLSAAAVRVLADFGRLAKAELDAAMEDEDYDGTDDGPVRSWIGSAVGPLSLRS